LAAGFDVLRAPTDAANDAHGPNEDVADDGRMPAHYPPALMPSYDERCSDLGGPRETTASCRRRQPSLMGRWQATPQIPAASCALYGEEVVCTRAAPDGTSSALRFHGALSVNEKDQA